MLLVAGQDLLARAELEAADHLREPFARGGRQRDLAGLAAEHCRVERAQLAARAPTRRSKCAAVRPSRSLALQLLRRRLRPRARAAARRCRRSGRRAARRTGNSARSPESSTNRENTRMSSAAEQHRCGSRPAQERERAEMTRFMRWAGERRGRAFADYDELWRWSVTELEDFWASIWEFCGVRASRAVRAGARLATRCRARAGSRAPS